MGVFSRHKERRNRTYKSENAQDDPDPEYSKRKDPYLVIGDAPRRPMFAGKGLESNTEYQFKRESQDGISGQLHPTHTSFRKQRSKPACREATPGTFMPSLICSIVQLKRYWDGARCCFECSV